MVARSPTSMMRRRGTARHAAQPRHRRREPSNSVYRGALLCRGQLLSTPHSTLSAAAIGKRASERGGSATRGRERSRAPTASCAPPAARAVPAPWPPRACPRCSSFSHPGKSGTCSTRPQPGGGGGGGERARGGGSRTLAAAPRRRRRPPPRRSLRLVEHSRPPQLCCASTTSAHPERGAPRGRSQTVAAAAARCAMRHLPRMVAGGKRRGS